MPNKATAPTVCFISDGLWISWRGNELTRKQGSMRHRSIAQPLVPLSTCSLVNWISFLSIPDLNEMICGLSVILSLSKNLFFCCIAQPYAKRVDPSTSSGWQIAQLNRFCSFLSKMKQTFGAVALNAECNSTSLQVFVYVWDRDYL